MSNNFGLKIAIAGILMIAAFGLGGMLLSPNDYLFGNGANSLDPDPYLIHLDKAQNAKSCMESSCKNDSLNHYKMALKVNPEGRGALDGILSELIELDDFDEALQYYQKLTKLYPEKNFIETFIAVPMFLGLKQYENALNASDAYLERMQWEKQEFAFEYALALTYKAKSLIGLDRFDEAIAVIDESYDLNPSGNTLVYKGMALSDQGKYQEALEVFEISKKNHIVEEDVYLLYLERGIALWHVGRYNEAKEVLNNITLENIDKPYGIEENEILDTREELQRLVNKS